MRGAAAVVDRLDRPAEPPRARLARSEAAIELALDALLAAADHHPLLVRRGEAEYAHAAAPAEVLIADDIRRDDLHDLVFRVGAQHRRDEPERGAAIGIE